MKVLEKIDTRGDGLGYEYWLVLSSFGAADILAVDLASDSPKIAHCHPAIAATSAHHWAFGVDIGTIICGVRWLAPFSGDPGEVINSAQVKEWSDSKPPMPTQDRLERFGDRPEDLI